MQQQSTAVVDYNALHRALREGLRARRVSPSCWMVTSSDGTREYEVCLDAAIRCQCQAGIEGRGCRHVAVVQVLSATADVPIQRRPSDAWYRLPQPDADLVPDDLANDAAAGSVLYWAES